MSPSIVVSPLLLTNSCRPSRTLTEEIFKDGNHLSCLPQSPDHICSQGSLICCQTAQIVEGEEWKPRNYYCNYYCGDMDPAVSFLLGHFWICRGDPKERISLLSSHDTSVGCTSQRRSAVSTGCLQSKPLSTELMGLVLLSGVSHSNDCLKYYPYRISICVWTMTLICRFVCVMRSALSGWGLTLLKRCGGWWVDR